VKARFRILENLAATGPLSWQIWDTVTQELIAAFLNPEDARGVMKRWNDYAASQEVPPLPKMTCDHKGGAEYHCTECCPGNCEMHRRRYELPGNIPPSVGVVHPGQRGA